MTWRVDHHAPTPIEAHRDFYGPGTYFVLLRGARPHVYYYDGQQMRYLGELGTVTLPDGFPAIEFRGDIDQIIVTPVERT